MTSEKLASADRRRRSRRRSVTRETDRAMQELASKSPTSKVRPVRRHRALEARWPRRGICADAIDQAAKRQEEQRDGTSSPTLMGECNFTDIGFSMSLQTNDLRSDARGHSTTYFPTSARWCRSQASFDRPLADRLLAKPSSLQFAELPRLRTRPLIAVRSRLFAQSSSGDDNEFTLKSSTVQSRRSCSRAELGDDDEATAERRLSGLALEGSSQPLSRDDHPDLLTIDRTNIVAPCSPLLGQVQKTRAE